MAVCKGYIYKFNVKIFLLFCPYIIYIYTYVQKSHYFSNVYASFI